MENAVWYEQWLNSPFYHKLYAENDKKQSFLRQLTARLDAPAGSRILDSACGRGENSQLLASMGFAVTGLDPAPDNIRRARKSETDLLEFYIHNLRLPFRGNYYQYAFNLFTSFGYYRTRREHDDAIRTIAKSLQPAGIFVIDYPNVHYTEEHLLRRETVSAGNTQYSIQRWDDETAFYNKISVADPSIPQSLEFMEKLTKFSLGDFTDMLSYQGLQVQEVFGDYDFSGYDIRKTPRLIVMAKKQFGQ